MEKEVYTIKDLMDKLGVCYTIAARKMREAKGCSDRLQIKGIIHKLDWEDFLNRGKAKKDNTSEQSAV